MLVIDMLLELLNKRKTWHNVDEIAEKASIPILEASSIINFLARYNFILLDKHGLKAKVAEDTHEFLIKIRQEEKTRSIHGVKRLSPRRSLKSLYASRKESPSSVI